MSFDCEPPKGSYYRRFPEPGADVTREQVAELADISGRVSARMMMQDHATVHPYYQFRERRLTEAAFAGSSLRSCGDVYTYRVSSACPEKCEPLRTGRKYSPWDSQNKNNVTKFVRDNAPCQPLCPPPSRPL